MSAPLLLALETATSAVSVALWREGALVGEAFALPDRPTSETLLPTLDGLFARAGLGIDAVEAFVVSIGPGSFTGLRIGVATVQGLAFGTGRLAVAVPTLQALAAVAPAGGPVVAVLDARRGEVYAAGFEADGSPAEWLPEGVHPAAGLTERVPPGCRIVGEGVAVCRGVGAEERSPAREGAPRWIPPPEGRARAARVAALGARGLAVGRVLDPADLVPRYVRRAEAEVKRTGERFEP